MNQKKSFEYRLCCVDCTDDTYKKALGKMIDLARPIGYKRFQHLCKDLMEWSVAHGYDSKPNRGLTLKNDSHVTYNCSSFQGTKCCFLVWSGIEYVWVPAFAKVPALRSPESFGYATDIANVETTIDYTVPGRVWSPFDANR